MVPFVDSTQPCVCPNALPHSRPLHRSGLLVAAEAAATTELDSFTAHDRRSYPLEPDYVWVDAHILATPALADVDGDGVMELICSVSYYYDEEDFNNHPHVRVVCLLRMQHTVGRRCFECCARASVDVRSFGHRCEHPQICGRRRCGVVVPPSECKCCLGLTKVQNIRAELI
jgi:hypothetical protein